jgi:hypothetical protein
MNEPYQRVSQDNGVFDGALIGAAVGAGGAGAGVFGTRMRYNGIEKRQQRDLGVLNRQKDLLTERADHLGDKFGSKLDKLNSKPNSPKRDRKISNIEDKWDKKVGGIESKMNKIDRDLAHVSNLDGLKQKHAYSKMSGGWRKAGIIGASAVVGSGVGMIADGLNRK